MGARALNTPSNWASYFVWRLHKDNGTDIDRYRAKSKLGGYLASDATVCPKLAVQLKVPNPSVKTADDILALLVANWDRTASQDDCLRNDLADTLRMENSDMRARIQRDLLYLASERHLTVPADLQGWQSDPKNSATDLDTVIDKWRHVGLSSSGTETKAGK